jgi:hypothetical protein
MSDITTRVANRAIARRVAARTVVAFKIPKEIEAPLKKSRKLIDDSYRQENTPALYKAMHSGVLQSQEAQAKAIAAVLDRAKKVQADEQKALEAYHKKYPDETDLFRILDEGDAYEAPEPPPALPPEVRAPDRLVKTLEGSLRHTLTRVKELKSQYRPDPRNAQLQISRFQSWGVVHDDGPDIAQDLLLTAELVAKKLEIVETATKRREERVEKIRKL